MATSKNKTPAAERYRLERSFAYRGRLVTRRRFAAVVEGMPAEHRDRYVASGAIADTEAEQDSGPKAGPTDTPKSTPKPTPKTDGDT